MSKKTVHISSPKQFNDLLASSTIVVADFFAEWCGPCKQVAPYYEKMSDNLSRPHKITFCKVDVDHQQQIAESYEITAMPTFLIFKNGATVSTIRGVDRQKLEETVKKLAAEAESTGSSRGFGDASGSSDDSWIGASLPKGYRDVTDQVDVRSLDLMNSDSEFGGARTLFNLTKPSGAASAEAIKGKGKDKASGAEEEKPDWVETDTDEQLMLFIPFQSMVKVHTIHITSLPPKPSDDDDSDDLPMRPKTIQIYSNRAHILGFEEAEDIPATQSITLGPRDWDEKTGTAKIELRFVKFQNVTSLVVFIVDGDGSSERVRVDRLRIIGETGEKRELGKLEKIGDEPGE
ncbi:MAG: hypothetical protein M1819_002751 [Sarea resinae]|nr:MAG: hypothetical protein M1819_002751 [Sarea resinae]